MSRFFLLILLVFLGCTNDNNSQGTDPDFVRPLGFGSSLIFEDSGELDSDRNAIANKIQETVNLVNDKMSVDNLRIRVRVSPANVIPEIGIGGFNPSSEEIIISLDPNFSQFNSSINTELAPLLAHEMHHAKRRRSVGYGSTLLEATVSEGLADCFSMEVMGIDPPIWSVAITGEQLEGWIDTAKMSWKNGSYNHASWFFGASDIPRWTGYSIGFKITKEFMEANPSRKASDLVNESALSFD